MDYAIEHEGKHYRPNGEIQIEDTEAYNRDIEAHELAWLKTAPDKVFLYVKDTTDSVSITTWLGTVISSKCEMLPRVYTGFNGAFRRPIRATIFGTRYVGWYMESSGNYCRLRKAKRQ